MQLTRPVLADIYQANKRIRETVQRTPLIKSAWLSDFTGREIYLKLECLQVTGSFKIRGATNKILSLSEDERNRGVIAVSSGNHGRAVAYVARQYGLPAVICVSETVPENKVTAIQDLGAEVMVTGKTYDEATETALQVQQDRGLTMIHPFDDPDVIAGQGTIGLEIMNQLPDVETVIVPLSGGGLLGGIALALKSIQPGIETIGVSMDKGAAMIDSLNAGRVVEILEEPSLADALIGGLGPENRYTFKINQKYVDRTLLVSEHEIAAGMTFALDNEHLVVEGGGAVGIAALLAEKVTDLGGKVALVISGSNVKMSTLIGCAQGTYPYQ
ncbi:MAG: hydroxyectoine utilization dehydratase EutB [Anaerolineales bacterium]